MSERQSVTWYREQAEILNKYLDGDLDATGLIEFLLEMSQRELANVKILVSNVLLHLLKLKYCCSEYPKNHWEKELKMVHLPNLKKKFYLGKRLQNRDLLNNFADEIMVDAYDMAVDDYKRESLEYSDLLPGAKMLKETCGLKLTDLITEVGIPSISGLLKYI